MFKLSGTVKSVGEKIQVSEKFAKRELVITDGSNDTYPQDIAFQFTQDKCDLLNQLSIGQQAEVTFSIKGREWTSPQGEVKYFNTLDAFRVEVLSASSATPAEEDADLPF